MNDELEQIIGCRSLEAAMRLAEAARVAGSSAFSDAAWLRVASYANSRAMSDPAWFVLCIFAHDERKAEVAVVDALVKRARAIVAQGPADDAYRDPERFFSGVRAFLAGDSSAAALEAFQGAMNVVFRADRRSPEWAKARLCFIRSRRLRELGRALRAVADGGVVVPPELAEWLVWADVNEIDGRVVS